jgi:hypothetical protein
MVVSQVVGRKTIPQKTITLTPSQEKNTLVGGADGSCSVAPPPSFAALAAAPVPPSGTASVVVVAKTKTISSLAPTRPTTLVGVVGEGEISPNKNKKKPCGFACTGVSPVKKKALPIAHRPAVAVVASSTVSARAAVPPVPKAVRLLGSPPVPHAGVQVVPVLGPAARAPTCPNGHALVPYKYFWDLVPTSWLCVVCYCPDVVDGSTLWECVACSWEACTPCFGGMLRRLAGPSVAASGSSFSSVVQSLATSYAAAAPLVPHAGVQEGIAVPSCAAAAPLVPHAGVQEGVAVPSLVGAGSPLVAGPTPPPFLVHTGPGPRLLPGSLRSSRCVLNLYLMVFALPSLGRRFSSMEPSTLFPLAGS